MPSFWQNMIPECFPRRVGKVPNWALQKMLNPYPRIAVGQGEK
jgi:hypothetical protein